jgi:type 1 glutamine amidotransferase
MGYTLLAIHHALAIFTRTGIIHSLELLQTMTRSETMNLSAMIRRNIMRQLGLAALLLIYTVCRISPASAAEKPHLVFVVGTHHYSPHVSMPVLAEEMERFGFETTVIVPPGDPEQNKNEVGVPGLEALEQADVAVFFVRFLTLNDEQFGHIHRYVKSGKPIVAFRTSTHAFRYSSDHPLFAWNDLFGRDVQGTDYLCHMKGATQCRPFKQAKKHPILTGVGDEPFTSAGTLYLTDLQPGCSPLVINAGSGSERLVKDQFRTRHVQASEEDIVAWTWEKNKYGARVFATSFGHLGDFASPQIMRIIVNGIHWAADVKVPPASRDVKTFTLADKTAQKKRNRARAGKR